METLNQSGANGSESSSPKWSIFDGRATTDLPPQLLENIDNKYPTLKKRAAATVVAAMNTAGLINDHRDTYAQLRELERKGRQLLETPGIDYSTRSQAITDQLDIMEPQVQSTGFFEDLAHAEVVKASVRKAADAVFAEIIEGKEPHASYILEETLSDLRARGAADGIPTLKVLETLLKQKAISPVRFRHCRSIITLLAITQTLGDRPIPEQKPKKLEQ